MTGHTDAFRDAILEHGWDPGPVCADGRWHYRSEPGRRDKACRYILHDMGTFLTGTFGNWREGDVWHKWNSKNGGGLSEEEKQAWAKRKAEIEAQQKSAEAKARDRAAYIMAHSTPAPPDHDYLIKKGIQKHIARVYKGMLAIPIMNETGLVSAQLISPDGTKRFLKGGKTKGGFTEIPGTGTPIVGEGFASMATVHEETGVPGFVAFSCGNLEAVAEMLFKKHGTKFVIAGDNDKDTHKPDGTPWNPGKEKALAVGYKYNAKVALPDIGNGQGSDFNDLAILEGPESVKKQIDAAMYAQDWLLKECQENGPGAAYRLENLEGLRLLKERDPASYRDLREKLRKLKVGITDLERELTKARSGQVAGFSHLALAKKVVDAFGPDNIIYSNGWFWLWKDTGVWKRADDRAIKTKIQAITNGLENTTRATLESVLDMVKTECYRPDHQWNVDTNSINCPNGELTWNGTEWTLGPHVKEHYRTAQIPVERDPAATAPRFEKYLEEITEGDADAEDKQVLLCEALGYALLSTAKHEKFFLFEGGGANGKSRYFDIVTAVAGRENVSAIPPARFGDKFAVAHLEGKLANIMPEIGIGAEVSDSELKALVSGDLVSAEHKFKEAFEFRSFATHFFGTNHQIRTRDYSEAFFRRAIVIPFTRTFTEDNQDKDLGDKLRAELTGILNLALEAVAGVLQRGHFTKTESSESAWAAWRLNADQIRQFFEDKVILERDAEIKTNDAFEAYKAWAEDAGIKKTISKNAFSGRMARLGADQKKGAGGVRLLVGVRLRTDMDN